MTPPWSGAHFRIGPSGVPVAGNTNASLNTRAMFANGVHASGNVPIATRGSIISMAIKKIWRQKFLRIPPQCFDEFFLFFHPRESHQRSIIFKNVVMDPQVLLIIIYGIVILLSDIGLAQHIFVKII
jgi:hypothetical protein